MAALRFFPLISDLLNLDKQLVELPCPGCAGHDPQLILRRDRYFLNVNLSACRTCGLVYLARGLRGEAQEVFYSRIYPQLMIQPPPADLIWNYRLIAGYRYSEITSVIGNFESVLDVGAGLGFFLDACRAHGCEHYLGLEPGGPQRKHATQSLGLEGKVLAQGLSASTCLPFKPMLITVFHVLEHLDEPGEALHKIAELIDPQGWLVIEVPDINAAWPQLGLHQVHISHRSYFCLETLEALLRKSGFAVSHVKREAYGIYEGNLRIYAQLGAQSMSTEPVTAQRLNDKIRHILGQIRPLSLRNGYPRAVLRLGKRSLRRR